MIAGPEGQLRIDHVCVGSSSDRFDDDEDWEIRVVDQETGQVLAKSSYRDNYSIMMGSRDSGEPAAIELSPDAKELWLTDKDGTRRSIRIAEPDPTLRELWSPGALSPIKWDEVERVSDGAWTEIRYRVAGYDLVARVDELTGEVDPAPIERVLFSPLGKLLVILRSDGSAGGILHDASPPSYEGDDGLARSPEGWFKGELVRGPLRWGDSDEWSMLFVWRVTTHARVMLLMDRDLGTGMWHFARPKTQMTGFEFLPGYRVEIEFDDGRKETWPYGDLVDEVDYTFRLTEDGRYAMVYDVKTHAGDHLQRIRIEIMDHTDYQIILDRVLERPGFDVLYAGLGQTQDGKPRVLLFSSDDSLVLELAWEELVGLPAPDASN